MASAVASNLPPAAVPYGWMSPRVSFSRDAAQVVGADMDVSSPAAAAMAVATPEPAISKDFIDFEFSLGGSATMLPADELFADGKLLPLRKPAAAAPFPDPDAATASQATPSPPPPPPAAMPAPAEPPIKPLRAAAVAAAAADGTTDPYVFSPKAPSCSSRWRELLGLKRAAAAQSPSAKHSSSPAGSKAAPAARSATSSSAAARSLKLLLQRNATGRGSGASSSDLASAPLLRDSSDSEASLSLASSRFSLSSSSSSSGGHDHDDVPRLSLDSAAIADPNPPRIRLVRSSHNHRHSTSGTTRPRAGRSPARRRPSPPRCLSVDSPRMNSSGKIVFQGLERSSSSPCSFHHAAARSRSSRAAVDRSYSSGVRVAPVVLNVPVCSRPVFGFFKQDKKDSSAAAGKDSSARSSALGRKAAQGWSGELPRSSG